MNAVRCSTGSVETVQLDARSARTLSSRSADEPRFAVASQTGTLCEPCAGALLRYATDEGPCSGHKTPEAESFADAAISFLECWGPGDGAARRTSP